MFFRARVDEIDFQIRIHLLGRRLIFRCATTCHVPEVDIICTKILESVEVRRERGQVGSRTRKRGAFQN